MALPNLIDLKAHLNYGASDNGSDDDELQLVLDAAIGVVENLIGPIAGTSITETHYGVFSPVLVLRQAPVQSVTSISLRTYPGLAGTAATVSDYLLDPEIGTLRSVNGWAFHGDVTVTYVAGRTSTPPAVLMATLVIAAHLWETQRGVSPTQLQTPDLVAGPSGAGYAVPNRAAELLEPYAQVRVA